MPEMNGVTGRAGDGNPVGNVASRRSRPGHRSSRPSESGTFLSPGGALPASRAGGLAEGHREEFIIEDPRRSDTQDRRSFRRGRTEGHGPSEVSRSASAAAGPWAVQRPDIVFHTPMRRCRAAALLVERRSFEPGDGKPLLPNLQ